MGAKTRSLAVVVCSLFAASVAEAQLALPCEEARDAVFDAEVRVSTLRSALLDLETEIAMIAAELDAARQALRKAEADLASARLDLREALVLGRSTRAARDRIAAAEALVSRIAADVARLEALLLDAYDRRAALREALARAEADLEAARKALEGCAEASEPLLIDLGDAVSVVLVPAPEPAAYVPPRKGCDDDDSTRLAEAFHEVCAQDLQATMGDALTAFSLNVFGALCSGDIPITLVCTACGDDAPSPCAWGAPDLPLALKLPTSGAMAEALRAAGGVTIHVCTSDGGDVPPLTRAGALAECGSLRAILAHELMHFMLNASSHASGAWSDLADAVFPGEHGNR